ncbi:MAG: OmpA family protein, partial [Bacteroidota bacterium]|nr:OmpA family protein [Bacteroidota bacterium]MDX5431069.1 OmpA family protein [Bacteroidota bacterium]MDX5469823.1 OmpA family protein [Bacteroidota bacterium]
MRSLLIVLLLVGSLAQAQFQQYSTTVYFSTNSSNLTPEAKKSLDSLVSFCQGLAQFEVELLAHTDQKGSYEFNEQLSARRERSVELYLHKKGIPETSIDGNAYGETMPEEEIEGEEDIAENRRVNLIVRYRVFQDAGEVLRQ